MSDEVKEIQQENSQSNLDAATTAREDAIAKAIEVVDAEASAEGEAEIDERIQEQKESGAAAMEAATDRVDAEDTHRDAKAEVRKAEADVRKAEVDPTIPQKELERRELALRQRELELKIAQQEVERLKQFDELAKLKTDNPLEFIRHAGIDPEDIVERILNDGKQGEGEISRKQQAQTERLHKEIAQLKKQVESDKAKQQLEKWKAEAKTIASSEDYEFLSNFAHLNGVTVEDLAAMRLGQIYQYTGRALTAKEIIDNLVEEVSPRWEKVVGKLGKVKAPAPEPNKAPPKKKSGTITNDMTPSGGGTISDIENWQDRLEAAAKMLDWKE